MFQPLSGVDASLSRHHAEEIQFALHTLARLHMHKSHRRTRHQSGLKDVFSVHRRIVTLSHVLFVAASSSAAAAVAAAAHPDSPYTDCSSCHCERPLRVFWPPA